MLLGLLLWFCANGAQQKSVLSAYGIAPKDKTAWQLYAHTSLAGLDSEMVARIQVQQY